MAKGTDYQRRYRTVIRDTQGQPIFVLGGGEAIIFGPDNQIIRQWNTENIQLVCGNVFNPAMNSGPNPFMPISVCERCRLPRSSIVSAHRPRHGLCSTKAGFTCHDCSQFLCPMHAIRCSDHRRRCEPCVLRFRARRALLRIFFRRD